MRCLYAKMADAPYAKRRKSEPLMLITTTALVVSAVFFALTATEWSATPEIAPLD